MLVLIKKVNFVSLKVLQDNNMSLSAIHLTNFKCFNDINVETSNITLLTGANGSGKTSLIYGVIGAFQTKDFPFSFSPNGKYVTMGDFLEMVNQHKPNSEIKIGFNFKDEVFNFDINSIWIRDKKSNLPKLKDLHVASEMFNLEISKNIKYHLKVNFPDSSDAVNQFLKPELLLNFMEGLSKQRIKKTPTKEGDEDGLEFIRDWMQPSQKEVLLTFSDFNELDRLMRGKGMYLVQNAYISLKASLESFSNKINFISSFRLHPERTYFETLKFDLKIGKFGENYVDQIIAWESQGNDQYMELISVMKNLGLFHDIKSQRIKGGRFELLVKMKLNSSWSSLADVGFGISQFLPIIVADLQLGNGSTLFIAQPEIHLHPEIQASFADYIVAQIKNKRKKYVIETHSEYLINRIRLCIAKEQIDLKDIRTYYLDNKGSDTQIHEIRFLKNGQIKGAPRGFFQTYMMDVMD